MFLGYIFHSTVFDESRMVIPPEWPCLYSMFRTRMIMSWSSRFRIPGDLVEIRCTKQSAPSFRKPLKSHPDIAKPQ